MRQAVGFGAWARTYERGVSWPRCANCGTAIKLRPPGWQTRCWWGCIPQPERWNVPAAQADQPAAPVVRARQSGRLRRIGRRWMARVLAPLGMCGSCGVPHRAGFMLRHPETALLRCLLCGDPAWPVVTSPPVGPFGEAWRTLRHQWALRWVVGR
jgi:hypothetical protein